MIAVVATTLISLVLAFYCWWKYIQKLPEITGPRPLPHFNIKTAKPRPYRPLRWKYHQTMALHALHLDYWIELESNYIDRIAQRKALYNKHGPMILDALPGSETACKELMHMVIHFLCQRYPRHFSFSRNVFQNGILGTTVNIQTKDPLQFLLDNVPEDFCIVIKDEHTNQHHLRAGVVCCAVGWSLGSKLGLSLDNIHLPVPKYPEKLKLSMNRFFSKLECDKPIERGAWSLEIGEQLFLQEDDPHYSVRSTQLDSLQVQDICFRVDWQTLRRLPSSRGIVFNFKAFFTRLPELQREPYIPKLLYIVLTEGDEEVLKYKSVEHVLHKALPALKQWSEEQEVKGLVPPNWEVRTLNEEPFFPGWQTYTDPGW